MMWVDAVIDYDIYAFIFYYCPFLFQQVKKSGKEPKVGAEITLGEMSRKTTVRPQTPFGIEVDYKIATVSVSNIDWPWYL